MSSFTKEQIDEWEEGRKKGKVDGLANMTETIKYLIPNGVSEAYKTGYAFGYENTHINNARNRPLVDVQQLTDIKGGPLDEKLQSKFIDHSPDPYDDDDIKSMGFEWSEEELKFVKEEERKQNNTKRRRTGGKSKRTRKSKKSKRTRKSKKSKK